MKKLINKEICIVFIMVKNLYMSLSMSGFEVNKILASIIVAIIIFVIIVSVVVLIACACKHRKGLLAMNQGALFLPTDWRMCTKCARNF